MLGCRRYTCIHACFSVEYCSRRLVNFRSSWTVIAGSQQHFILSIRYPSVISPERSANRALPALPNWSGKSFRTWCPDIRSSIRCTLEMQFLSPCICAASRMCPFVSSISADTIGASKAMFFMWTSSLATKAPHSCCLCTSATPSSCFSLSVQRANALVPISTIGLLSSLIASRRSGHSALHICCPSSASATADSTRAAELNPTSSVGPILAAVTWRRAASMYDQQYFNTSQTLNVLVWIPRPS
mmetsp:Transcript_35495/g.94473  ORF Transcript_35495/g.94473 Transcript_35495/m.94473 type:complete len:244 (-) Transcript_35495:2539-3270(-)